MKLLQLPSIIFILFVCFFVGWVVSSGMMSVDNQLAEPKDENLVKHQASTTSNMAGDNIETGMTKPKQAYTITNRVVAEADTIKTGAAPPLVVAARKQIGVTVSYNPDYQVIDFPMGDIPLDKGVCTDVIIRAYREQGQDLQQLVNTDMKQAWSQYPNNWNLKAPDSNIDHRRVANLRVFFQRHGSRLKVSSKPTDYKAGDMVTWKMGNRPHIGIVSNRATRDGVPLIIHNVGSGTREENVLFAYDITGHYRY